MPLFNALNFVLFQAGWFVAALLQDRGIWIMLALIAVHFATSPTRVPDAKLLLILLPVGLTMEVLMIALGLVVFNSAFVLPMWMILLWCLLILSFNHSLRWFRDIPVAIQVILSGALGVASYVAAQKFDALSIGEPLFYSGLAIMLVWAIQLPVMMVITKQVNAEEVSCANN